MATYNQEPRELGGGVRPPSYDGPRSFRDLTTGKGRAYDRSRSDRRTYDSSKSKGKRSDSSRGKGPARDIDPNTPRSIAYGYPYDHNRQCYIDNMNHEVDEHGYLIRPPKGLGPLM